MKRMLIFLVFLLGNFSFSFEYRILFLEEQNFIVKDPIWNPENIFNVESGLNANLKLLFETKFVFENFKIKISDLANMPFETNGNFTNSMLEGYLSVNLFDSYIDVGKKKTPKGKGFLFSPSDKYSIENGKTREETLQFRDGLWLFGGGYYSEIGNFSFYYFPEISLSNEFVERYFTKGQEDSYSLSYSYNLDFMDIGLVGAYRDSFNVGFYGSLRANENFIFYLDVAFLEKDKTYYLKKDSYPYIGEIYEIMEKEISNKIQFVYGLNYLYENLGIIVEYYYNGCGWTKEELDNYKSDLKNAVKNFDINKSFSVGNLGTSVNVLSKKPSLSLSLHYGMIKIYSINLKNFDLASLYTLSLTDFSGRFHNSISYNIENLTISGEIFITLGDEYSEFKLSGEKWGVELSCEFVW